jgi:diguanylate cyclase (GGDEF)-like protein
MYKWWQNWLTNNQHFTKENSDYRRIVMINVTLSLMILVLLGYGVFNIVTVDYKLAIAEFIAAIIAIALLVFFKLTHRIETTSMIGTGLLLSALTAVMLLDEQQTYIYVWALTMPAVSFFILGRIRGIIASLLFGVFTALLIIFYAPANGGPAFELFGFINLFGPYVATSVIIGYFEVSRMDSLEEMRKINKELRILSETDKLTSIYNRLKLDEALNQEIRKAEQSRKPLSIIMIDVDNFKVINDTYGHLMGDSVLTQTAYLLRKEVGNTKIIGRWGGEEFLIICPYTDLETAGNLARKLGKLIEVFSFDGKATITISLGVASYHPGDTIETIIRRADHALYEAKNRGKNRAHESQEKAV